MAVLSDASIKHVRQEGGLAIDPFDEANLTPNGYDLSVGEVVVPEADDVVEATEGVAVVPGRERFLVSTREVVTLGAGVTAQLWIRSTFARRGVLAAFGKVEAGFSGTLTIGCFNASKEALELPIGERFCQIAFEALSGEADELYEQRSGNYQHQRGVTLSSSRK